jgi:hypothetical protein
VSDVTVVPNLSSTSEESAIGKVGDLTDFWKVPRTWLRALILNVEKVLYHPTLYSGKRKIQINLRGIWRFGLIGKPERTGRRLDRGKYPPVYFSAFPFLFPKKFRGRVITQKIGSRGMPWFTKKAARRVNTSSVVGKEISSSYKR